MKQLSDPEIKFLKACNKNELNLIISKYYPYAKQKITESEKITYSKSNNSDSESLTLSFNRNGDIKGCEVFDENVFKTIRDSVNDSLHKKEIKFSHIAILTSRNIVDNYYLQGNKILIRPVANPVVTNQILSSYPAILEFQYEGSNDIRVNAARLSRRKAEILWSLNTVFTFTVVEAEFDNIDYYGFELTEEFNSNSNLIFRKGYSITDFEAILPLIKGNQENEMLIWEKLKISNFPVTDDTSYLSDDRFNYENFVVPYYSFFILGKAFYNLDDVKRPFFFKASYWFNKAVTEKKSKAAIILALASALESLIDQKATKCEKCSQNVYSIKTKIEWLICEYCAAFNDKDKNLADTVKKFYDLRSDTVHAKSLPFFDIDNERGFDPLLNKITFNINYYIFIVRCVILNWYTDKQLTQELSYIKTKFSWFTESYINISF